MGRFATSGETICSIGSGAVFTAVKTWLEGTFVSASWGTWNAHWSRYPTIRAHSPRQEASPKIEPGILSRPRRHRWPLMSRPAPTDGEKPLRGAPVATTAATPPIDGGVGPRVLELRVHGVNNTAPADMLDLPAESVHQTAGDALGSFWRPTTEGHDRLIEKGLLDPGIEREFYSWGGMARSSVGGTSGIGKAVAGAARIGWTLLVPFGLVNLAYWSRRFDDGPGSRGVGSPRGWRYSRGAPSLRLAGLLLTLLMATTTAVVTLDLIAVQCYDGTRQVCTNLPTQMNFLAGWGQTRRLAILGVVPVLVVAALVALSAATRLRYEQPDPDDGGREAANASPVWPLLSTRGFWSHQRITKVTSWLHLAATGALMAVLTAWHVAFGTVPSCHDGGMFGHFDAQCRNAVLQWGSRSLWELGVVACGLVTLGLVAFSVVVHSEDACDVVAAPRMQPLRRTVHVLALRAGRTVAVSAAPRRRWVTWVAMLASLAVFVVQTTLLAWPQPTPTNTRLVGVAGLVIVLIGAMLAASMSALLWRSHGQGLVRLAPGCLGVTLVVGVAAAAWPSASPTLRLAGIGVAGVAAVVMWRIRRFNLKAHEAWGGAAPGVFLLLATVFALILSSAVAVAAGDWLNGSASAADLAHHVVERQAAADAPPPDVQQVGQLGVGIPLPYIWFGFAIIFAVLVLIGFVATAAVRSLRWPNPPSASDPQSAGAPIISPLALRARGPVVQTRRLAACAHRAERLVAALTGCGAIALVFAFWAAISGRVPPNKLLAGGIDIGMWLLAGAGITVIGLASGGKALGGARPLGLLWDLICFLPRAGHPLAPPCYAERAVPELAARMRAWLDPDRASARPDSMVVLSAHSLGALLAVAVVLTPDTKLLAPQRISLLSYGTQLRAYFTRVFPELIGPVVLGVPPCLQGRLWPHDPWATEIAAKEHLDKFAVGSVRDRLGGQNAALRWRSLWRRTDYLGFPVSQYVDSPIDKPAEELVALDYLTEIQTHGGYPRTPAYREALRALTAPVQQPTTPAEPDATPLLPELKYLRLH